MSRAFSRAACALVLSLAVAGCATTGPRTSQLEPFSSRAGKAGYHLLMAELALQRRLYGAASEQYALAATLSDDPRLAERATRVAVESQAQEAALTAARRWRELEDSVEAQRYVALLTLRAGDVDGAAGEFAALLDRLAPDTGEGLLALGALLNEEGDSDSATRVFRELARRYETHAEAWYGLGRLALSTGDLNEALDAATRASELDPEWEAAHVLQARVLLARGEVDEGLAIARGLSAGDDRRLELALMLSAAGRNEEARMELEAVLEATPNQPEALRALGLIELEEGDLEEAQVRFTELLATGHQTSDAFFFLGALAEERGLNTRALRPYAQVQDGPYAAEARVSGARLFHRLGQSDTALRILDEFGRIHPQYDVQMTLARGNLLDAMGEREAALDAYDEGLQRRPGNIDLRYARAFHLEADDRVDEAISELRGILDARPHDATALNALGYTLADRTRRLREAYRLIARAYAQAPDNPAIVDSMGWVEYRRGNLDAALAHLQHSYELMPEAEIAAHLGEVLWVMGERERALQVWEEGLADNPDDPTLRETVERLQP